MTNSAATIVPDMKIGCWRVLAVNDRRVTAQCQCGSIRILSAPALLDKSASMSCGCAAIPRRQIEALRPHKGSNSAICAIPAQGQCRRPIGGKNARRNPRFYWLVPVCRGAAMETGVSH